MHRVRPVLRGDTDDTRPPPEKVEQTVEHCRNGSYTKNRGQFVPPQKPVPTPEESFRMLLTAKSAKKHVQGPEAREISALKLFAGTPRA